MEQISLLKAHVIQGCLSHVEPGGGTNYNEALHCYINPHFNHAGRIGIPLAFAFLTILFTSKIARRCHLAQYLFH